MTAWVDYARFEIENGEGGHARNCYERAVDMFGERDDIEEGAKLFVGFAEFEEWCKEVERARCIYKFVLDRIPKGCAEELV